MIPEQTASGFSSPVFCHVPPKIVRGILRIPTVYPHFIIWRFPEMGGTPIAGWFIRTNPTKMDENWGYPYDSGKPHISSDWNTVRCEEFPNRNQPSERWFSEGPIPWLWRGWVPGLHRHIVRECPLAPKRTRSLRRQRRWAMRRQSLAVISGHHFFSVQRPT